MVIIIDKLDITNISPTNDSVFKYIFGTPQNADITKSFLEAILNIPITSIDIDQNKDLYRVAIDDKLGILDIKCLINNVILCDIESQVVKEQAILKRAEYYLDKLYFSQLKIDNEYSSLKKCICILILNFEIDETKSLNGYHSIFNRSDSTNTIILDDTELHVIELPKVKKYKGEITQKEMLLNFIINPNDKEVKKYMKLNESIKRAYEQYKYFMSDEGKRRIAELREKKRLDDLYHRNSALAEGKAKGIVESKFQIAKQLFKMNMKITDISKITNLSETELKKALYI